MRGGSRKNQEDLAPNFEAFNRYATPGVCFLIINVNVNKSLIKSLILLPEDLVGEIEYLFRSNIFNLTILINNL